MNITSSNKIQFNLPAMEKDKNFLLTEIKSKEKFTGARNILELTSAINQMTAGNNLNRDELENLKKGVDLIQKNVIEISNNEESVFYKIIDSIFPKGEGARKRKSDRLLTQSALSEQLKSISKGIDAKINLSHASTEHLSDNSDYLINDIGREINPKISQLSKDEITESYFLSIINQLSNVDGPLFQIENINNMVHDLTLKKSPEYSEFEIQAAILLMAKDRLNAIDYYKLVSLFSGPNDFITDKKINSDQLITYYSWSSAVNYLNSVSNEHLNSLGKEEEIALGRQLKENIALAERNLTECRDKDYKKQSDLIIKFSKDPYLILQSDRIINNFCSLIEAHPNESPEFFMKALSEQFILFCNALKEIHPTITNESSFDLKVALLIAAKDRCTHYQYGTLSKWFRDNNYLEDKGAWSKDSKKGLTVATSHFVPWNNAMQFIADCADEERHMPK